MTASNEEDDKHDTPSKRSKKGVENESSGDELGAEEYV